MSQDNRKRLADMLVPMPPAPQGARQPLPKEIPNQPRRAKMVDTVLQGLMGLLGLDDPLAPEASPATGVGALLGMAGPVVMGGLKRVANPIRAYHGSPERNLKTLSPNKAMEVRGTTWFTNNPDVAGQYAYPREYGEILFDEPRGRVYEANLHISNPMTVDMKGDVGEAIRLGTLSRQAKDLGHDALILNNVDDTVDSSRQMGTSYAVWDPDVIEILRKYGILPPIGAAAASQALPKKESK